MTRSAETLSTLGNKRVNVTGHPVPYDPDALTADAEWAEHNLSRVRDSLPNGYCGRPPPSSSTCTANKPA
jgi:hypothetical protein